MKILNNLTNNNYNSKLDISKFIKQLTERLKIMERELTIDRFEGNMAVCEDRKTKEIINIDLSQLPEDVKEGSCLKFENGRYIHDIEKENETYNRIKQKMDNLWE